MILNTVELRDGRVMSLPDALAHALGKYLQAKDAHGIRALLLGEAQLEERSRNDNGQSRAHSGYKLKCPDCGAALVFEEACAKCHACGFSQC